jgi:hypothetical protein
MTRVSLAVAAAAAVVGAAAAAAAAPRAAVAAAPPFACATDMDCQLNGACSSATGACSCRPGWTGPDCGQLDLLPAPTTHAFFRNASASWGGSIVWDDSAGAFFMFLAFIEGHCGLNAWQPNSAIYRAVSADPLNPLGPYVNETLIRPWFAHNPSVSRHPDGSLLVWHIGGGGGGGGFDSSCTNGTTPPAPPPPPVKLTNGGRCLTANGTWPCWAGGPNKTPWHACPLTAGDCADPTAEWSLESSGFVSHAVPSAGINIDCNACKAGTVAKMFDAGASGLAFNGTTGQIEVTGCPGWCLTNGVSPGANAPCGGGTEPWGPTQIHLAPCTSPDTMGWGKESTGGRAAAGSSIAPALATGTDSWPRPPTDVNVVVFPSGSVMGQFYTTGILQGDRSPFPFETDNPSPLVFPNGTTWVMFRSWNPPGNTTTPIGIARSSGASWNSTYELPASPVPVGFPNATEPVYVPLEDPFMWLDAESGTFHALFHNMGGCRDVGCHAFSADGLAWFLATSDPYTTTVDFQGGTSITYARRERPHLVLNKKGQPAFLSNGVQETWANDHSYTLVQPLNVEWP